MGGRLLVGWNVLKAWLLVAGGCALLAAIAWPFGGYRLVSLLVFFGLLVAGAAYWYGDRVALGMVGARELPLGQYPALHSTVQRLAAVAGIPKPRLFLLADGHPRVLTAGRGPRGAALAVSRGFLGAATPAELEGVFAHELAHIRNRDILVQTSVAVLAAALLETSRIGGWLSRALLFVLGPIAAALVHLLLSPKREFAADRAAAALCGSPHGLADALIRLEQAAELVEFRANPATEPLYTFNPFAEEGLAALFVTHPPVGERVRRLRELDPTWREKLRAA
ncbi:MAG: M48 family metalloprotease [Actinomycetota bacterium]|nr:M48 family metalloprotease [Actinomycetota bacterium]